MLEILIKDLDVKPSIFTKSSISDIAKSILPFCSYKYDFSNSTMIHEGDFIVFSLRIYQKSLHNPHTTPAQAVSRVSQASHVGRAQPFAQGIYFGEMSLSNERSCTTHPPNPLYKPARFNIIYHVWNCLESLYCCCVFLFRMSSDSIL